MGDNSQNIKLSICIPTYNRAQYIGETIQNVISQAKDNVEIVIVDGASTDNTAEVINGFQHKFSNLLYYRGEENMGVDRDMAKTIELSRGDYCWMLSDDDLLQPGSINKILEEIKTGYEIYLCNATACSLTMTPRYDKYWLSRVVKDRVFSLHEKQDFIEYCKNAKSIGALFSYMSSVILRREAWNGRGYNYEFDRSAYALAASLFSFRKQKCRVKYIRSHLILCRSDNDSFLDEGGLVKRLLLDFDGYLKLADKYFPDEDDKDARKAFLDVMKRTYRWYTIIHVTSFIENPEAWIRFRSKLIAFGYNPRMIALCYALGRYKGIVSMGVKIKRKIVRSIFHRCIQNITEFFLTSKRRRKRHNSR
jgi:abequosyltransferase